MKSLKSPTRKSNKSPEREFFAQPSAPIESERAEDYQILYSNNVQVAYSLYDFRLHFNDVISHTPKAVEVEELLSIVLSPEIARDLHQALGRGLASYVERFGSLRGSSDQE